MVVGWGMGDAGLPAEGFEREGQRAAAAGGAGVLVPGQGGREAAGPPLPERVDTVLGDRIYVPRAGLPPALVNRLMRLAAFQNPAFYSAQAMRRSTFGIPRIVACSELLPHHIALPRGCRGALEELLGDLGTSVDLRDERNPGDPGRMSEKRIRGYGSLGYSVERLDVRTVA